MWFSSLVNALILKSADDDLFVGKPKRNLLSMVSKYSDGHSMYLAKHKKDDESRKLLLMPGGDYFMGFSGKDKQVLMQNFKWRTKVVSYTVNLTYDKSFIFKYDKKNCVGYSDDDLNLKIVPCNSKKYHTKFLLFKDKKDEDKNNSYLIFNYTNNEMNYDVDSREIDDKKIKTFKRFDPIQFYFK